MEGHDVHRLCERGARMKWKVVIAVFVLLPVIAHFAYGIAVSPFANYYVTVDEYSARATAGSMQVRVGGQVVPGSIQWDNASKTMRFQVTGDLTTLDVVYRGPVPDSFRDGVTAVLEGAKSPNGAFAASGITIKCPHQYLPAG